MRMALPKTAQEFAKLFDHTILKANATDQEIKTVCHQALEHSFYSVCVNSGVLPMVAKELQNSSVLPIAVVGFPLGAMATEAKVFETKYCIDHGAREIDMVLSVGDVLSQKTARACEDIEAVINAAQDIPVKVIIETAYLNKTQIQEMSRWCATLGAAFVKTSTGFASRGASVEDIQTIAATLKDTAGKQLPQIKASGGIRTLADVKAMVEAGAHRIGASATVSIMQEFMGKGATAPSSGY
jgi:deoxyribose-phosphate aldolase